MSASISIRSCGWQPHCRQCERLKPRFTTSNRKICGKLCGSSFTAQLLSDIDVLQNAGLAKLDRDVHRRLRARYAAQLENPYAQALATWLRGEFVFDPQSLTA
jgi:hypothetical protein